MTDLWLTGRLHDDERVAPRVLLSEGGVDAIGDVLPRERYDDV